MRAIIGSKLGEYVGYVTLNSRFAQEKLISNQFVGITGCN